MTRRKLPDIREGVTKKAKVGSLAYYLTLNFYPDSNIPAEVFIQIAKEGSTVAGLIDALAITLSIAFQHGVEHGVLCDKFLHTIFEPRDSQSSSLVDSIAKTIMACVEERSKLLSPKKEDESSEEQERSTPLITELGIGGVTLVLKDALPTEPGEYTIKVVDAKLTTSAKALGERGDIAARTLAESKDKSNN